MPLFRPVPIAIISAVVLVLIGIFIVESRRPAVPNGNAGTWGSIEGYLNPLPANAPVAIPAEHDLPPLDPERDTLVLPPGSTTPSVRDVTQGASETFEVLLAEIAREIRSNSSQSSETSYTALELAFDLPSVVIPIPQSQLRTAEQQAYFDYGNAIGAHIQAFTNSHTNMVQVLADQTTDRTSKRKNDAVKALGSEYRALGNTILNVSPIPSGLERAHEALGASYEELGDALQRVPDAVEDQAYIAAITAYNSTADTQTQSYINMITLFSLKGITFSESDPGVVFSFQGN